VAAAILAAALTGCRQDMHDAPRYDPLEASALTPNAPSALAPVAGTVARGHLNANALLYTGMQDGAPATVFPFAMTRADLDRGQERYNIYCAPCHSRTGDGLGMVVQRGYREAPSYHLDRLREAPVGYFFDVMTNGFGAMPDYRAQVSVEDRWRIAAYIRVLQLSVQGTTADVPPAELEKLKRGGGN
jgi:mono/diheme cytochrome c family protein